MPKKKDLEEIFVEALEKNHIFFTGKVFNMGASAILADYMFTDTMVVFMDSVVLTKVDNLKRFKKMFTRFEIILVTKNPNEFMGQNIFSEIYDESSLKDLIKKLKRISSKKAI